MAALGLIAASFVAVSVHAALGRSYWYDEFYTLYVTRPTAPVGLLWGEWLRDNHPPLFYLASWCTQALGSSIGARRLVNPLFLFAAAAGLVVLARRRPEARSMLFAYAVALAGSVPAIERVSELRSNFLAFAAGALALASLAVLAAPGDNRRGLRSTVFLCATLMVALCIHIASTLIIGSIALTFGLAAIASRDWPGTRRLLAIGIVAFLPFAITFAVQYATISANTRSFWIEGGFPAARWAIELEIIAALKANWPLTAAGAAGLTMLFAQCWRERRIVPQASLIVTIGVGMALAIVLMVAIHMQRPFVIERYLVCLDAAICLILAICAARLSAALGRQWQLPLDLAIVAAALITINHHRIAAESRAGWQGTGRVIAEAVRQCPGTLVHVDMDWNRSTMELPPRENRLAVPFAYAEVARDMGFALEPTGSRRMSGGACPTLFWAEHVGALHPDSVAMMTHLRSMGFPVQGGTLVRIGNGWIFRARGRTDS